MRHLGSGAAPTLDAAGQTPGHAIAAVRASSRSPMLEAAKAPEMRPKRFPQNCGNFMSGIMSPNASENWASTWNAVYVPYCDGTSFSSELAEPLVSTRILGKTMRDAVGNK